MVHTVFRTCLGLLRSIAVCFVVFYLAYLLHCGAENAVALVIRNLNRPQKLNAESLDPCWVSFHSYGEQRGHAK